MAKEKGHMHTDPSTAIATIAESMDIERASASGDGGIHGVPD